MDEAKLKITNLSKSYNGKVIFKELNLELKEKQSLVITGKNGSGKSTLLKVISHLIRPEKGEIKIEINNKIVPTEKVFTCTGLLAPYINVYDELTAFENLEFFYKLKVGTNNSGDIIKGLLEKVGLYKRRNDLIRDYSSGMKQRVKLAYSVLNNPPILFMDEPRTNLDEEGIAVVYKIAEEQKQKGILLIATNEKEDTVLCENKICIEDYK